MNQQLTTNPLDPLESDSFDQIKISLASPETILRWSHGEIKKPETINYRTFKPERDGLFCARIFGPVKDYECLCGKYKRMKFKGVVCEKCGVEVTQQKVRRDRMGHIELATPVAHIWFLKSLPSRIGLVLDMTLRQLESVLYFEKHVVTDPGLTELSYRQLLTEDEYLEAQDEFGSSAFTAKIGAEAVRDMLADVNLETEAEALRAELEETKSEIRLKKIVKRLKVVEYFIESRNKPEWMVMTVVPVIPPELRPLVPLDGGRFATSDLNDLYRRVINRNNRLKKMIDLRAPDIILRNEKRMLQESVDALFDNTRRSRAFTGRNRRPLKSLSDMLKGKQGRFRQNLLGKRVDFSGRSVIVTGPELKMHQCGLPKKMALELFKPYIYSKLEMLGKSSTVKQAKKLVESELPEIWDLLDEIIREHPVLLNRAPTLHRLGIQAFEPVLIEGKAIQLHPLVCTAFNADFDGDQMAVHVPLSLEAQLEARVLMMSTNNVLSPANGKPIVVPSQDMILGLYYLSLMRAGMPGEGMVFSGPDEVEQALSLGEVHLHAKIQCRVRHLTEEGEEELRRVETTPGRVRVGALLPLNPRTPFDIVNRLLRKKEVGEIIDTVYRYCGQKESVIFCDQIMALGFHEACKAGISFGKDDLLVPDSKVETVSKAREMVANFERQYMDGLITQGEKYNKIVDEWTRCSDEVADAMTREISAQRQEESGADCEPNSVYMMAHSGARGSPAQMKQLAGMRGLMSKPSGEIIETPIISNFKEGLTVLEYFNSTHGARKGLTDTALKTANSGYLTRRLVDVAQDCIVRTQDCGTDRSIVVYPATSEGEVVSSLGERTLGRTAAEDISVEGIDEPIAREGELIDEAMADKLDSLSVESVKIRSPLICDAEDGICAKCYGRDLARGTEVNIGEAVGILAAQSIGEPGTQLTMRTFHIGGIAQGGQQSVQNAGHAGKVAIMDGEVIESSSGALIAMSRNMKIQILDEKGAILASYKPGFGAAVFARDGASVSRGDKLYEWDAYMEPIIAETGGEARLVDLISGVSFREETDDATGLSQKIVIDWSAHFRSRDDVKTAGATGVVSIEEDGGDTVVRIAPESGGSKKKKEALEHRIDRGSQMRVLVQDGDRVQKGDVLAGFKPDIQLVDESGERIRFGVDKDGKEKLARYPMPVGAILNVEEGQKVKAGDVIASIPREGAKSRDITGGLPRVAELFEARRPKDNAIISEVDGVVQVSDYRNKQRVTVYPDDRDLEPVEYMIAKGKHIPVRDGDRVQRGEYIVDGNPAPHDILRIKGIEALAEYMVDEVQKVYRIQGVKLNDKHIEVILRQMLQKWEIVDPGQTTLLMGDQVEKIQLEEINKLAEEKGHKPARGHPILLGITKACLQTRSFISAASFQETTRVLTEASIQGKRDRLIGLKENIIVGRLIPSGTGGASNRIRGVARARDRDIMEEKRLAREAEEAKRLTAEGGIDPESVFGAKPEGAGEEPANSET